MFESISPWGWVALAWGELIVAYGAYLVYLGRRRRRLEQDRERE